MPTISKILKAAEKATSGDGGSLLSRNLISRQRWDEFIWVMRADMGLIGANDGPPSGYDESHRQCFRELMGEHGGDFIFMDSEERKGYERKLARAIHAKFMVNIAVKLLCKLNLYFLTKCVLGYSDLEPSPHLKFAEHIQDNVSQNTNILPRGYFKTTISTKSGSIWLIINRPNIRILICNATATNAELFLKEIKAHFESNDLFRGLFSELLPKNYKEIPWSNNKMQIVRGETWSEPTIYAVGTETNVTSGHFNVIIKDDLVNEDHLTSPEMMQKPIEWEKMSHSLYVPEDDPKKKLDWSTGTRWSYFDYMHNRLEVTDASQKFILSCYNDNGESTFPQKFPNEELARIKDAQGPKVFSCLPWEAPILMDDWSIRRIGHIKVGDYVKGFTTDSTVSKHRQMVRSKVLAIHTERAKTVRVFMKSGAEFRCTPDHKWQIRTSVDSSHKSLYAEAKVGRSLKKVLEVDRIRPPHQLDWAWLGGIIDGEGACKHGSIQITQSKKDNPEVCQRIEKTLNTLGIDYNVWEREPHKKDGVLHQESTHYVLRGGRQTKFDIINESRLAKRAQIAENLDKHSAHMCSEDRVVYISPEESEDRTVYNIQTETGNYIAYGYASKNCQYLNNPLPSEIATFKEEWLKYYTEIPKDQPMRTYLLVDPAISESKQADNRAIIVVGVMENKDWYVLDYVRGIFPLVDTDNSGRKNLVAEFFRLISMWNPEFVGIEESGFQKALTYLIEKEKQRRGQYFGITRLLPRNRQTKLMRIETLAAPFAAGRVYIKKEMKELISELLGFPAGRYKDLIDALSYLTQYEVPPSQPLHSDNNPLSMTNILNELESKHSRKYPFEYQLGRQ